MLYPGAQSLEVAEVGDKDVLSFAVHDGGGVTVQSAADRDDVAADLRMGSEFQISQHGNGVTVDLAVDIGAAEHGHGAVIHRPIDPGIAEDGYDVFRFAINRRGAEDR